MRNKILLLAAVLALIVPTARAQTPYTDAWLNSLNFNTVYPCGNQGNATQQLHDALVNITKFGGGTIDFTCYQADTTITTDLFSSIAVPVAFILSEHTMTIAANATIPAYVTLVYRPGSALAADPGFAIVNNSTPTRSATGYQQLDLGVSAAPTLTPGTAGTLALGTYYYCVTSLPSSGGQSQCSAEAHVTLTGVQDSVGLTWPSDGGAATYRVYRGTASGAENVYYTSATNSLTDTGAAGTAGSPPSTNTAWVGIGASSSGTAISFNGGSAFSLANFNDTTPTASACSENINWQTSGASVSAELLLNLGNNCTVIDATLQSGADFGVRMASALAKAYAAGGGIVTGEGFACPAYCYIGTANLTMGDGTHPVRVKMPTGTVTRSIIAGTGVSAQILYNSHLTVNAENTTITGPGDVAGITQAYSATGVTDVHWFGGNVTTSSTVAGVPALQIGGLNSAIPMPVPPNVSYATDNGLGNFPIAPTYAPFGGRLAQNAKYNKGLTAAQILCHYQAGIVSGTGCSGTAYESVITADAPISYWPLKETSGTTAHDLVSSRNGTYTGSITLGSAGGIPGDSGTTSALLDGVSSYVLLPTASWFPTNDYTIEGWIYPTYAITDATHVPAGRWAFDNFGISGNDGVTFGETNPGITGYGIYAQHDFNSGAINVIGSTSLITPAGQWSYVAVTYISGNLTIYIDGVATVVGTDVSHSDFNNLTVNGGDIGVLLNSIHGCDCYINLNNVNAAGSTVGAKTMNSSGYAYGVNVINWPAGSLGGPIGLWESGSDKNTYTGLDFENNENAIGSILYATPSGSANYGSGYTVGDTVKPSSGGDGTAVLRVASVSGGANGVLTLSVVTPGTTYGTLMPDTKYQGGAQTVATTNLTGTGCGGLGCGTGLKIDYVVSAANLVLSTGGAYIINPYEENSGADYLCGQGNYVEGAWGPSNGSFYSPTFCLGITGTYAGGVSDFIWGPGSVPNSVGVGHTIVLDGQQMYQSGSESGALSWVDGTGVAAVDYTLDLATSGLGQSTYGKYGHTTRFSVGQLNPYSGIAAQGLSTFAALPNPSQPTTTVVGTAGTASVTYAVVGHDRSGGVTLPSAFSPTLMTAPNTLNLTNYVHICWSVEDGIQSWDILKGNSSTSLALLQAPGIAVGATSVCFNDTGQSTSAYSAPARNTTGDASIAGYLKLGTPPSDGSTVVCLDASGYISTGCGSSGPVAWSALTNPTGNLALSMGTDTSIFSGTAATNQFFAWKNTTAAVVGTSQGSPVLAACGRAFHGSADVEDCMTFSELPGNGNDAAIAFNIRHTGSSTGAVTTNFPGPVSIPGSVGLFIGAEGACTGAVAGSDVLCADATLHALKSSLNNGAFTAIPQLAGDLGGTAASPQVTNGSHITNSSIPNTGLVNTTITFNGQSVALGATGNVNSGAATHSIALNEGAGAAMTGLAVGAGNLVYGVASADPAALSLSFVSTPTWNAGSTMAWDVASKPYASLSLLPTHNTASTLNPSHLINGGQYVVTLTQDAIGTGTTTLNLGTAGTAPTCTTWYVLNSTDYAIATSVTITATANHADVLTFTFDGTTNCYAPYH